MSGEPGSGRSLCSRGPTLTSDHVLRSYRARVVGDDVGREKRCEPTCLRGPSCLSVQPLLRLRPGASVRQ